MRTRRLTPVLFATAITAAFSCVFGWANSTQAADEPDITQVVTNLENPSGVVVHSGTGHVFVASRFGVHRYDPKAPLAHLEISDYPEPTDIYGKGPKYDIGPLGLAFLDDVHLVVGDGSRKDGSELVRIYKIGPAPLAPAKYQKEEDAAITLGPLTPSEETAKGEGNFYGIAVGAGSIFVTCNGDDTKGWVSRAEITDGKPGDLKPFIATKVATGVDAPVPITFSPDGKDLVIGQMGEMNVPNDSLLTIYDPSSGNLKKSLKTGLHDIAGMAYSPKTGKLYVTDFAWLNTSEGGLFELEVKDEEVNAKKILGLDKPTALAFDSEGRLYLTTFGTAEEGSEMSPGGLYVIQPGL